MTQLEKHRRRLVLAYLSRDAERVYGAVEAATRRLDMIPDTQEMRRFACQLAQEAEAVGRDIEREISQGNPSP